MSEFAKFRAGVISKAEYDSEGVGYSTVGADFPIVFGPLAVYDQVDILMKPWGRGSSGEPLHINETAVDRWTRQVTTEGVDSESAYATPTKDTIPAVCIVIVTVTDISVLAGIDGHAKHFVLGVDGPNDLQGNPLPPALQDLEFDDPLPLARWTTLRNGLVTLGLDAQTIDDWRTANPDGTPREFGQAYQNYLKSLIGAA